jgi:hypothetical protein
MTDASFVQVERRRHSWRLVRGKDLLVAPTF